MPIFEGFRIFLAISKHLLSQISLREATKLRSICKCFNKAMLECIYRLPVFENAQTIDRDSLGRDHRMAKEMIVGLIMAKMGLADMENRPLCLAIKRGADICVERAADICVEQAAKKNSVHDDYAKMLGRVAADRMDLSRIIYYTSSHLELGKVIEYSESTALIAAIRSGEIPLIRQLLPQDASVLVKPLFFFGRPLSVAARTGSLSIVDMLLERIPQVSMADLVGRMKAFQAAAESGHEDIVSRILGIAGFIQHKHDIYANAVKAAIANGHGSVTLLLLRNRISLPDKRMEHDFWYSVIDLLGQTNQLKTLFSALALEKFTAPYCDYALYWAAYNGNQKIFDDIRREAGAPTIRSAVRSISGAIKGGKTDMLPYVFRRLDCFSRANEQQILHTVKSGKKDFALHFMLQPAAPPTYPCIISTNDCMNLTHIYVQRGMGDISESNSSVSGSNSAVPKRNCSVPESNCLAPESNSAVPESNSSVPQSNNSVPKSNSSVAIPIRHRR